VRDHSQVFLGLLDEMSDAKQVMADSIEPILERGEKLEEILEKVTGLANCRGTFRSVVAAVLELFAGILCCIFHVIYVPCRKLPWAQR
jgi:hypothetical protein